MRILILFVVFEIISTSQAELQQQGSRRIAWLHGSATVGPHIQTGVVPIFDKRNTMEPITFTFTTPLPRDHPTPIHIQSSYQSLPSLRPSDRFEAPYAHPTPIRMSSYKPSFHSSFAQQPPPIFTQNFQIPSSISARSAYLPSSPSNRFIPPSHPSPPSPPSKFPDLFGREIDGVRHNALQSWTQITVTIPSDNDNTATVTSTTSRVFRITLPYPMQKRRRLVTTTPLSLLGILREPRTISIQDSPTERVPSGSNSTTVDNGLISIDLQVVKNTIWDVVDFLKGAVAEAGVDRDWRALWTKMSGVVEPYVERMTEHLGSAINIALRQQNNRRMRTTSSPYFIYTNNQNKRMKRS